MQVPIHVLAGGNASTQAGPRKVRTFLTPDVDRDPETPLQHFTAWTHYIGEGAPKRSRDFGCAGSGRSLHLAEPTEMLASMGRLR